MTGTKQRTIYKKKRKSIFAGIRKQDLPIQKTGNNDDTIAASSPAAKKNPSFEKTITNCPLMELYAKSTCKKN